MTDDVWPLTVDSPPRADCAARWTRIRGVGRDPAFRAVCGQGRCPGSLGRLEESLLADPDAMDAFYAEWRRGLETMDRLLAPTEQHIYVPPGAAGAEEAEAFLAELRARVARSLVDVEQSGRVDRAIVRELAARPAARPLLPRWLIFPERPHREPGTPPARSPRPVYYGYPDTGYRISLAGRRSRRGDRIGRRPALPGPNAIDIASMPKPYGADRQVDGQYPVPPCRIVCPVCGARNHLDPPPGFALVDAED